MDCAGAAKIVSERKEIKRVLIINGEADGLTPTASARELLEGDDYLGGAKKGEQATEAD